jgi:hypothetical protein
MTIETVQVSRRDLDLQLTMYVLFAGTAGFLVLRGLSRIIDFYPALVALNFALTALLLFPAFRVWKQSRGRETPKFLPLLRTLISVSIAIFAVTWMLRLE